MSDTRYKQSGRYVSLREDAPTFIWQPSASEPLLVHLSLRVMGGSVAFNLGVRPKPRKSGGRLATIELADAGLSDDAMSRIADASSGMTASEPFLVLPDDQSWGCPPNFYFNGAVAARRLPTSAAEVKVYAYMVTAN